ncbi:MAG: 4-hydroxybenzoyl-CoA reductase [Acidobacteria bacterium]|nr:MAG: 4-hydroxybenzoyl-CoA reductase [Acidobacteriota bacterium]
MLRLPSFKYYAPASVEEAVDILGQSPETMMIVAGGTDVLPNMKRGQWKPKTLVGLRGIRELAVMMPGPGGSRIIGAGTTLSTLVGDELLQKNVRGLWQAAAQVATPHLRNMATIGGNLCLDTRCTYYDQSEEWRKAIGYCMKKDGSTCWVATSSKRCLAVSSTDTAPMLLALGAKVTLVSASGSRDVAVDDFYNNDGMSYLTKRADELLTSVSLPNLRGWTTSYWKLRRRGSFDFPVGAAAIALKLDGGVVEHARIALGAVASRPLLSEKASALLIGQKLTDEAIAAAAAAAYDIAKPMDNTDFELVWRKKMVKSLVTSALREARGDDMRAKRLSLARQIL